MKPNTLVECINDGGKQDLLKNGERYYVVNSMFVEPEDRTYLYILHEPTRSVNIFNLERFEVISEPEEVKGQNWLKNHKFHQEGVTVSNRKEEGFITLAVDSLTVKFDKQDLALLARQVGLSPKDLI